MAGERNQLLRQDRLPDAEELAFIRCAQFFQRLRRHRHGKSHRQFPGGFQYRRSEELSAQNFIEGIHSETYARLLMLYCPEDYRSGSSPCIDPFG